MTFDNFISFLILYIDINYNEGDDFLKPIFCLFENRFFIYFVYYRIELEWTYV